MEKPSADDLMEISVNYKGTDVTMVVTLEEANVLMNDDAVAAKYVEALLANERPEISHQCPILKQQTDKFNTREATLLFLALRTQYNEKFNDRKIQKNALWQIIATEMKNNGYDIPEGRDGAEKCRQKFANLQRGYLNYKKHMKTTGTEKRDFPPYFDEMDAILGNKDKVSPPYLEDSLNINSRNTNEAVVSCSSSCSSSNDDQNSSSLINKQKEIKNRFSASHTSVRPTTNLNKVIELFKEQHEELREDKKKHMRIFEDAIRVQNEQRERFFDLLQKIEKRRRSSSSSH